mgnify:CR=1 FL=1
MSTALQTMDVAGELPALFELSKHLVESGFLPEHIRKPGQAVAIILAGRELGMPPMRALRSLMIVKGKVEESADSQLGRFKEAGGKAIFQRLDEEVAVLELTHPNGDPHVETFSLADAKRAGLTASQTWQKYPKAMLRSRCITAGLKSVGWDGAAGAYDPDETKEIGPVAAPQPTIMQPRRLSERKQPTIPDHIPVMGIIEPQAEEPADPDLVDTLMASIDEINAKANVAQVTNSYITEAQRKRLFGIFKGSGHTPEQVKAWLGKSSKEITQHEYDAICERLSDPTPLVA